MAEGISYDWIVNAKLDGIDVGIKKLDVAAGATAKLDMGTAKLGVDVGATTSKVDKFGQELGKLSAHHQKATAEGQKHAEGFKGIGHSVDEARGKLNGFFEFTGALLAVEAIKKITESVFELGKEIVNAAAGEERTKKSFMLNFGTEGGKEALEYAERFSRHTEFTEDQAEAFIAPLLNAGVPLKQMDMYMAAAGDSASKFQNKLEGMATTIEALRRVELSGKLDGRTARALNIGVPQLAELDEFKGKSDKQLKKVLSDGSLSKDQLFRLIAGRDNTLGDQAVEMSETMGAKLDKLGALPERLFQEFMNAPAFDVLKSKIDGILETLDPSAPGGQKIIAGIGALADGLISMFENVNAKDLVEGLMAIMEFIPPALDVVISMARGVNMAFDAVAGAISSTILWVEELPDKFSNVYDRMKQIGGNILGGIKDGIVGGITGVIDAVGNVGTAITDKFKNVLGIHSPSLVFKELGRYTGEGYAIGLAESGRGIADAMDTALPTPQISRSNRTVLGSVSLGGVHVNVSAHAGSDAHDLAQRIGEAVQSLVPPMLIHALEGVALESGAA